MFRIPLAGPACVAISALLLVGCGGSATGGDDSGGTLTVMTFNAWGGGQNEGKLIDETLAVLRRVDADIIALQETRAESAVCEADDCPPAGPSVANVLADRLGYYVHEQEGESNELWANAILSRYPIGARSSNDLGVLIEMAGRRVALFNVHLDDYPYQPYQLAGIDYADQPFLTTEEEAIAAADSARGEAIGELLAEIDGFAPADVVFVCGDFNEPSHRDWTARAAEAGRHPLAVRFPSVRRLEEAGFVDAYRAVYPDEIEKPAFTWTPMSEGIYEGDHHDRIDFVLARGENLRVRSAAIVGESPAAAEIVVVPWPSDHRAVVATFSFE